MIIAPDSGLWLCCIAHIEMTALTPVRKSPRVRAPQASHAANGTQATACGGEQM
jgi:hypothetical protein